MHNKRMMGLAFCITALAMSASAQTVTGSGTTNTVPVFTGTSSVGNSPITVSGVNVGIGTTIPVGQLSNSSINYGDLGSGQYTNTFNWNNTSAAGWNSISSTSSLGLVVATDQTNGVTFQVSSGIYNPITGQRANHLLSVLGTGSVGIGTTTPAYNLDVTGTIRATTGVVFPDGTTQVTAFLPANCGADHAEAVDVSGDRTKYEPGDVLVIDPGAPGKFLKANQAYSTLVAGIYSTKPGFVGRLVPADPKTKEKEVPMAMVGRVPTKVSAENGPIKVGDLLVASSRMGYAMKGTDRSQMLGAVIGKALGSLDSGIGVIEVLVTLQ